MFCISRTYNIPLYEYCTMFLFNGRHSNCFQFWVVMKTTAGPSSVCLLVTLWTHSVGNLPNNDVSGSQVMCIFSFSRFCQTAFQSDCTDLHSHQPCVIFRVPVAPHPHQRLLLSVFFFLATLIDGCEAVMGLVCIVLMGVEVEYHFSGLLPIYIFSLPIYLYHTWTRNSTNIFNLNCGCFSFLGE